MEMDEDHWLNPDKYDQWGSPLTEDVLRQRQEAKAQRQDVWLTKQQARVTKILDTREAVNELLVKLEQACGTSPAFVVDCEGFNRYRLECDVMELYHISEDILYLLDVWVLGKDVFDWISPGYDFSIRDFLESPGHIKLMYDCRQDANALKMSYDISLQGVADLSLMVTDLRGRSSQWNQGWHHRVSVEEAIKEYLRGRNLICEFEYQAMLDAKDGRRRLAGHEVFAIRPLDSALIEYTQDVRLMGVMFQRCLQKHYKGANSFEWDAILGVSDRDASHAGTDLFNRESARGQETPWSDPKHYFADPFEKWSDIKAERAQKFEAEISSRRAIGHKRLSWDDINIYCHHSSMTSSQEPNQQQVQLSLCV